jgi:hypothetical protein
VNESGHDIKLSPSTAVVCVIVELLMGYVYFTKNNAHVKSPFVPMMIAIPLVAFSTLLKRAHWVYTVLYVAIGLLCAYMFINSDYQHFLNP